MPNFDLQTDYLLEDGRALLRPLTQADVQYLLRFSLHEPELWQHSLSTAAGETNLEQYVAAALNGRVKGKEYPYIVFDKQTGSYAGSTRFYDLQPAQQNTQLGFTWYGKAYQRTGLNRHCKYLMLQFAFTTMNMMRVEFRADALNERSIAAMKAIGCVPEGILRSNGLRPNGTRRDSMVLSILKQEWEDTVSGLLQAKMQLG